VNEEYCIVITTVADDSNGQEIIEVLLAERLAACIQVMPVQSCYHWQGKVNRDTEKLVLIKTKRSLYAKVQEFILANHAYEIPEIIQVPIADGFPGYLSWIAKECPEY
jgi:periplasmic divalent cation tolerance protein